MSASVTVAQSRMARSRTWYGSPGSPRSASVTRALVTSPRPAAFRPALASRPASTTVTKSGPSSGLASSTISVWAEWSSQSQFWPRSVAVRESPGAGTTAKALHSAGGTGTRVARGAWRALAAYITSVRTLMASTSGRSSPAPSAMPRISSR